MSLWKKIIAGFGLALLVLAGVGFVSYQSTNRMVETAAWVNHTHEVLNILAGVRSSLREAETDDRGYVLSGKADYLARYPAAVSEARRDLKRLRWLTRDNPRQQHRLDAMQPFVDRRLALLEQSLALRRAAVFHKGNSAEDAAQAHRQVALMAQGDALEDQSVVVETQMVAEERLLLTRRTGAATASARAAQSTIVFGTALALGLMALAIWLINRDIRLRRHAEEAVRQSEELYHALAANFPNGSVFLFDRDLRYTLADGMGLAETGPSKETVEGKTLWEVFAPEVCADLEPPYRSALAGQASALEIPYFGRVYLMQTLPVKNGSGDIFAGMVMTQDITARKWTEAALQQANAELYQANDELESRVRERTAELSEQQAFLRQVIDTDPNFIFVKDADGRFLLANTAVAEAYGTTPDNMVGRCDADFNPNSEELKQFPNTDQSLLASGDDQLVFEETITDAQGRQRLLQTVKRPLLTSEDASAQVLGICMDITARKALEAEGERLLRRTENLLADALERVDRDPLTGLINHRAFHERLGEEADRAQREGMPLAIAVVDLDNFKFFNDCYGHPVGDEVLQTVAAALRSGGRSYDTLARFGGDEFALVLPGVGPAEAAQIPARLRLLHSHRCSRGCGRFPR